ncbi:MAG: DUF3857 domain-containing protein [Porphyrobacter sp.]|nr:DUF3857 domain-containing protein [Porphyrobacter sp.]
MTGRSVAGLLVVTALAWGNPALAGEEVLYQSAPAWVVEASLPDVKPGPPLLVFDDQRRIDEGRLWTYVDRAVRIDNPQMLTALGTVQAGWLPDKGDLIVHRVSIIRDGQVIDLLGQGTKFEILRRERQLEQRMIDGLRTATLAVPGLRVGDVLRVSYTVSLSDQALDKEVQATAVLPSAPSEAKFGRVRISWPADADIKWGATKSVTLPEPVVRDGFATLELKVPLTEAAPMPEDAPLRYRMPPLLQVGTFADWPEVSRVMAPLFATEGTIAPGSPIAREVERIEAAHAQPLERAVAALRLVQDEIAYMLNGMEGGNYIPQSPKQTWDMRYGDCKAKTLLLLAMLREMEIEAEAVTVSSAIGDAVPGMLPMPSAFDHVIVHAVINGEDFWLDGTNYGASMDVVREVPPFHYALPLRLAGAELMPMPQRPQQSYDQVGKITFDHRAGLDVPALFDAEWTLTGAYAARYRAVIGQTAEDQLQDYIQDFATGELGEGYVYDGQLTYDEGSNTATLKVKGLMASPWEWDRGVGTRPFSLPTQSVQFRPDRARTAWRDIPVAVPGPYSEDSEITVLLPESAQPYALEGKPSFDVEIAKIRLHRASALSGGRLTISDQTSWPGGEIAPADVSAERQKAARFGNSQLMLRAPADAQRRYDAAARQDRKRFAPIEAAYAKLIEREPDDLNTYRGRAQFRAATWDWQGAMSDLDTVIDREGSADDYLVRAALRTEAGTLEDALADAEEAWELEPSLTAAFALANILPYFDRVDEAISLLENQAGNAEQQRAIAMAVSELEAQAGRKEEGLERIDGLLAERPNDPDMLNAKCWYQATWNFRAEELADLCTQAVEKAVFSPPVLDSRAMGYYRLGRYADALKDLEAALSVSPELAPALFMRGVVKREMGDRGGENDIREALARQPSIERHYARYGIKAD